MSPAADSDLYAAEQPASLPPGQRLLCDAIDHFAASEPGRVWASTPRSSDLSQGYIDVTYAEWANAINHAAYWLEATFGSQPAGRSKVIVYRGPYDVRYPTLYIAGIKTSIRMFCLSYFVSVENQLNLLETLNCDALVHTGDDPFLAQLQAGRPSLRGVVVPAVSEWFTPTPAPTYPLPSYIELAEEPAVIFHTSGTTAAEKPFCYTNRMLAGIDLVGANPRLPPTATPKLMSRRRWYTSFPLHTVIGLQPVVPMAVFWGAIPIINPHIAGIMPTAEDILAVLRHGHIDGIQATPKQLAELCQQPAAKPLLAKLLLVQYAGSKLSAGTGDALASQSIRLQAMIGSTESGGYPTLSHNDPDWRYLKFAPVPGLEFRPWKVSGEAVAYPSRAAVNVLGTTGDITALRPPPGLPAKAAPTPTGPPPSAPRPAPPGLYELVFLFNRKLPHGQQIFNVKPELQQDGYFRTGDVFSPHPTKPGMWLMEGRTVDFWSFPDSTKSNTSNNGLINGDDSQFSSILNVSAYEDALLSLAGDVIAGVMVGGRSSRPYVLLELKAAHRTAASERAALVAVGEANAQLGLRGAARVRGGRVLFADGEKKKFIWNSKDVVNRAGTMQVFAADIDALPQPADV